MGTTISLSPIGDKLMVVGEGPDGLETELGGFNSDVGGADGSVGCEGAGEMAVADVGTTREAVIGDKLVVVGEGPDRLEPELGGFNGDVGGADGSVEGVAIVGVAEVCVGILELRLRVCITAGAVSLQTGKLPGR